MELEEAITSRRSSRDFSPEKPEIEKILKAIDYARFAPAAGNLFITKFIIVSDKKSIEEISQACQQDFVAKAHYLVVAVSDDSQLKRLFPERAERYARQQSSLAIENFLLGLTEQSLVTTWVGHFSDDQIKRILDIPDKIFIEAIFPIGKSSFKQPNKRFKTSIENIIFFDKWGNKSTKPTPKIKQEHF